MLVVYLITSFGARIVYIADQRLLMTNNGLTFCDYVGNRAQKQLHTVVNNVGECTLHSRSCGIGCGIFMLVNSGSVLLIRGGRAVYLPATFALYLDSAGDAPTTSLAGHLHGHTRQLYLSQARVQRLNELYIGHEVAKEVVRRRTTADRIIRFNWY
jgi:hypothetical protein